MSQAGRNDPCPCGSGKKYKKCCFIKSSAPRNVLIQTAQTDSLDLNSTNVSLPSDLLMKAVALHQAGRLEDAKVIYRELLGKNPTDSHALHYLGLIALQLGNFSEAANLIEKAIKTDSRIPAFHCNLGNAYKELRQFDLAASAFLEAVKLDPQFQIAYCNLGNTYLDQGILDEAINSYRKALTLNPGFTEALFGLGNALQEKGELEEAVRCYRQAVKIKPDYAKAYCNLGNCLQKQDQLDEAAACLRQALSISPDNVEALSNLGLVLQKQEKLDDAVDCYRKLLSLKPDSEGAHFSLGNLFTELGKFEDAAVSYRTYLEIDPKDHRGARLLLAAVGNEPMPSRASAAHLDDLYTKRAPVWDKETNYCGAGLVAQALQQLLPNSRNTHILDAGCGTGLVGLQIRDLALQLDGVDMSPRMLEVARGKGIYDQLYQSDLESFMSNNPEKFGAVACAATLIHFGDLTSVFSAAATCLKDYGLFVFTLFPNTDENGGKEVVVAQLPGLAKGGCYAHANKYVIRLAEATGFVVEMLKTDIHEYHNDVPIMGLIVVLRRRARLAHS